MSTYPKPLNWVQNTFNPANWPSYSNFITIASANKLYISKIGDDTDFGNLTLKKRLYLTDANISIYNAGVNDFRINVGGVDRIQQTSSSTRINQPVLLSDGSLGSPAYSFINETGLGWYRAGNGDIRLSQLGSDALTYSGSQFLVNGRQRTTIAGTASNPAIKIGTDDTNMTGFYNNGIFALTASVGQVAVADFRYTAGAQGIRLFGNLSGNNALYSASVLGYYEDTGYISGTFNWGNKTAVSNYRFTRIGNKVTFHIQSQLVFTAPSTIQYAVTLLGFATRFRPGTSVYYGSCLVNDNGTETLWYVLITSGGDIKIGRPGSGSILPVTVFPTVITWLI